MINLVGVYNPITWVPLIIKDEMTIPNIPPPENEDWFTCKVGPNHNNSYKWPKINGFAWGYFTSTSGVIAPSL